jgi:hypothetical protein
MRRDPSGRLAFNQFLLIFNGLRALAKPLLGPREGAGDSVSPIVLLRWSGPRLGVIALYCWEHD